MRHCRVLGLQARHAVAGTSDRQEDSHSHRIASNRDRGRREPTYKTSNDIRREVLVSNGNHTRSQISITKRDRVGTVIRSLLHGEAFVPNKATTRPDLSSASDPERGIMTCQASDDDDLPPHLAADAEMCERLIRQGCSGNDWERFVAVLYRKATRVTYRWLLEGTIFAESAKIGRHVAAGDLSEWNQDDIRALAHEVVQETFTLFQKQLLDRKYDASRGATLFTYFMNAVARQFPNVFRRTVNSRRSWGNRVELHDDSRVYERPDMTGHLETHTRYAALLFSLIDGISSAQQRTAAWLSFAEGLSNEQIARQLDISPDAARALVNRARGSMQRIYLQQQREEEG
jgi:RNA polymerase sigma factor (sigma-70 family)